jgi:hypothetical protein
MLAKVLEFIVGGVIVVGITAWVGQFVFGLLWIPVRTTLVYRRLKRHCCPDCKAPFVKHWAVPADQLYSSKTTHSECANGHVYVSGNARFADWADF